ncbi:hypothetical protein DLD77_05970 [Chitinophaga alhagiae]|uniref:Uncharacterized protein n=1 Tax=Chitinophaga alhagiae TaxID=2203219 RepID=A0ABM6WBL4_9BACT|nr:hypothetical protein DLD77_05970 [Chitinophaga alhagiae]
MRAGGRGVARRQLFNPGARAWYVAAGFSPPAQGLGMLPPVFHPRRKGLICRRRPFNPGARA